MRLIKFDFDKDSMLLNHYSFALFTVKQNLKKMVWFTRQYKKKVFLYVLETVNVHSKILM